ncbi:MAG: type II and III secretion system protein family protein [Flavobacteriaceae bacterium]|nr:MAG: type II and III secretion system protein family protein [Flavobacteriaceae bacterium]
MFSSTISKIGRLIFIIHFIAFAFVIPEIANADNTLLAETIDAKRLELISGKSIILKSALPIKRVSIADPEVADFVLLSANEIYLKGKTAGITNLTLWQNKKVVAIYDLQVTYDISRLKQKIHTILPLEKSIQVTSTNDYITLSGKISNASNLSQAVALAKAYAPDDKVNNFVEVGGVHQVMLEVRVAEMSRSLTKRLGINFAYARGGDFGVSTLGGLTEANSDGGLLGISPAINALFRFGYGGSATWTFLIDALREDNLVKILAEPTLITLSGQSANFLAGGEFPIPVPQGLGTVGIQYKQFGVALVFTPTVFSKDKINIEVTPEVSELDFQNAIRVEGFVTPGITTRRASTMVELGDGQSFAIAGLLREATRADIAKYPLLGDIPILGALFQSKTFQKAETELVIIVTPHLVKPLEVAKQSLPGDEYNEPNDFDFYFNGAIEGKSKKSSSSDVTGLDGEFGHSVPEE